MEKSIFSDSDSVVNVYSKASANANEQTPLIRRFIRHPSDIPISFDVVEQKQSADSPLINVSRGGLCFSSHSPISIGASIHIRIQLRHPVFEVDAAVAWCKPEEDHYAVGVEFDDVSAAYSVRMVEQVCYIEQYRKYVLVSEGRDISSEQAAQEWIQKYAADFPSH